MRFNMNKKLVILQIYHALISFVNGESPSSKKLVCVVGAGVSGLNAIKHLADYSDEFTPVAFEKRSDVGGLWVYSDKVDDLDILSPMYKNLRARGAKEIMACPDYPEFYGENRGSPSHESVLQYLQNYTDHFNLRQFIQFNTRVEKITPTENHENEHSTKWLLKIRRLIDNSTEEIVCDAMMISTGLQNIPNVPEIPGIHGFSGRVLHSAEYRKPEDFANQTVVILGAGISGVEIAGDLSKHAKTVYLSHSHKKVMVKPENVIQVAAVIAVNDSDLILRDGQVINSVDSFIFCTGYEMDLSFLDESAGVQLFDGHLYPVYKSIVNVANPTMGFVGFNSSIRTFCPLFYTEASYFVSLLRGKFELPHYEMMMEIVKEDVTQTYVGKANLTKLNELAEEAHFAPIPDFYAKADSVWTELKKTNPFDYRDYNLVVLEDGNITVAKATDD